MHAAALREVTRGEIDAYRRDGAVLLRGILPREWVEKTAAGLEEARHAPGDMRPCVRSNMGG